ncbi:lamin-like protein [Tanacetum coccineum]
MRASGGALWRNMVVMMVVTAVMVTCVMCRNPVRHQVGGPDLWIPNHNYTDWLSNETFYVGDWLYFVYKKEMYNVLEVNETSYTSCNEKGFISNLTRGAGRDVFELKHPKPYYFLASGGYCYNGMKLAVNVVDYVPAPEPSPATNGCYMIHGIGMFVLTIVITVWAILV